MVLWEQFPVNFVAAKQFSVIFAHFYFFFHPARYLKFPQKQRLLTSEEFHEQGLLETTRALAELKEYCNSPESKPWRMMSRLKDPQR